MISGKPLHEDAGEFCFAVEENSVVRNKYIIKYYERFHAAKPAVAHINIGALQLSRIAGLTAHDHKNAFCIGGTCERNRIIPVFRSHGLGRHDNHLMGIDKACLMSLCAADHDTVGTSLHYMEEQIRILLRMRGQGAVTFRVCHGAVHSQILLLCILEELFKVFEIMGAIFFINFIRGAVNGVESVHSDTALEAGRCLLTAEPLHFYFLDEILGVHVDVGKAVDFFSRQVGGTRHQILIFRHLCQIIGHFYGIKRRTQDRVVDRVFNFFPKHINLKVQLPHTFYILFSCH